MRPKEHCNQSNRNFCNVSSTNYLSNLSARMPVGSYKRVRLKQCQLPRIITKIAREISPSPRECNWPKIDLRLRSYAEYEKELLNNSNSKYKLQRIHPVINMFGSFLVRTNQRLLQKKDWQFQRCCF